MDENSDGFFNVCPQIYCDTTISDLTCYQSDGNSPVSSIYTFACPSDRTCNL